MAGEETDELLEEAKALIDIGLSVDEAEKYTGDIFSGAQREALERCVLKYMREELKRRERQLDELIEYQVERGKEAALIWAMERKIPKYAAKGLAGGDVHLYVKEEDFSDIVEEG
jgi:hypothetical protein